MGVLHSFFIKNIFYDKKDLRLFLFSRDDIHLWKVFYENFVSVMSHFEISVTPCNKLSNFIIPVMLCNIFCHIL